MDATMTDQQDTRESDRTLFAHAVVRTVRSAEFSAWLTSASPDDILGGIALAVRTGDAITQTYFTLDEARGLALMLGAAVERAEKARGQDGGEQR